MGLFDFLNPSASPYRTQQGNAAGQLTGIGNTYDGMATAAGNAYGQWSPQADAAVNSEADLLRQGIGDSARTGLINQATGNVGNNYLRGQSNLSANLAGRGFGGSGSMAGGLSGLERDRVGAISTAANNANNYAQTRQMQNAGALTGLLGGQASQAYGRQTGALGAQAGIAGQQFGEYGQLAGEDEARRASGLNAVTGLLSTAAGIYGMSRGQKRMNDGSDDYPYLKNGAGAGQAG